MPLIYTKQRGPKKARTFLVLNLFNKKGPMKCTQNEFFLGSTTRAYHNPDLSYIAYISLKKMGLIAYISLNMMGYIAYISLNMMGYIAYISLNMMGYIAYISLNIWAI